jgi:hypothetical protein
VPSSEPQLVVQPLAYKAEEAAAALSVSVSTFERYIRPHVPCVYLGRCRIYPVPGLATWLENNSEIAGG